MGNEDVLGTRVGIPVGNRLPQSWASLGITGAEAKRSQLGDLFGGEEIGDRARMNPAFGQIDLDIVLVERLVALKKESWKPHRCFFRCHAAASAGSRRAQTALLIWIS